MEFYSPSYLFSLTLSCVCLDDDDRENWFFSFVVAIEFFIQFNRKGLLQGDINEVRTQPQRQEQISENTHILAVIEKSEIVCYFGIYSFYNICKWK